MESPEATKIREMVLEMQSRARLMLESVVDCLLGARSPGVLDQIEQSDADLDNAEREVDNWVLRCLALRRPVSRVLRFMLVSTRIASHWERIGDEVTGIARQARHMGGLTGARAEALREMTLLLFAMMDNLRPLLASDDAGEARQLVLQDKKIDALNKRIFAQECAAIESDKTAVGDHIRLLLVSRGLERIGDHVKHIAQDIHFMHHEEDIRHTAPGANSPNRDNPESYTI